MSRKRTRQHKPATERPLSPEGKTAMAGNPNYASLRLLAARMLDQNPELARALETDLSGAHQTVVDRKPVDAESTEALNQQFLSTGSKNILCSMATQFRHKDWVDRDRREPLPNGPTRTLYHFTSLFHLPVVLKFGIARGDVCICPDDESRNYNAPWLTSDPSFHRQGWAEGPDDSGPNSTFDKREVRLTVAIPEGDPSLSTWAEVRDRENVEAFWVEALEQDGGDPLAWYIYNGLIPRAWVTAVEYRDKPTLESGRYGILRNFKLPS